MHVKALLRKRLHSGTRRTIQAQTTLFGRARPVRHRLHAIRNIRLRKPAGEHDQDFGFGLAGHVFEQLSVVLGREALGDERKTGEVQAAIRDHLQREGKALRCVRAGDAAMRLALTHPEAISVM